MFRLGKWAVAGLAISMLAPRTARAGVGFQPVSPDEIKMKSEPLAPGAGMTMAALPMKTTTFGSRS